MNPRDLMIAGVFMSTNSLKHREYCGIVGAPIAIGDVQPYS